MPLTARQAHWLPGLRVQSLHRRFWPATALVQALALLGYPADQHLAQPSSISCGRYGWNRQGSIMSVAELA